MGKYDRPNQQPKIDKVKAEILKIAATLPPNA
jgi:hypothetical protein